MFVGDGLFPCFLRTELLKGLWHSWLVYIS